ncbi:hypothetical protein [Sorangium sp. So ce128]|uniref:hypothetical protein n=1 Tax=Sorangium sp. So ce128 TaxID=3133281 RepID=UPI003F6152B7
MARALEVASVVFTSAFAGGSLLVSTAVASSFSSMRPSEFLDWFAVHGPRMGMTLFPLNVGGTVACGYNLFSAIKRKQHPLPWGLATACMAGTLILLPLYFARANEALIGKTIDVREVPEVITSWSKWQWGRTGLSIMAALFAGVGARRATSG